MADKVVEAVSIELTPPMVIVPPFAADIPCANKFGLLIVPHGRNMILYIAHRRQEMFTHLENECLACVLGNIRFEPQNNRKH